MYFKLPTVLSLALVAAVVAPVLSVPVAPLHAEQDRVDYPFNDHEGHGATRLSDHERRQLVGELLGGLLARSSPSPEPTHFCLMESANNGKGCDTAQCKSGGGSCVLNSSTNRCNMNNMRGKSAPFACLGCKCTLEKS